MTIDDTGWKPITGIVGDGDTHAAGHIEMVQGNEARPCFACRSWERDQKKIVEYFMSQGLVPDATGAFVTPIAKDLPGRQSMRLDPRNFGFCRLDCIATEMQATCKQWTPVKLASELQSRICGRDP